MPGRGVGLIAPRPQITPDTNQDNLVSSVLDRMHKQHPYYGPTMGPAKRTVADTVFNAYNTVKDQPVMRLANSFKNMYNTNNDIWSNFYLRDAPNALKSFMGNFSANLEAPGLENSGISGPSAATQKKIINGRK